MKVAVSACLLGENCKYNGGNNRNEAVLDYVKGKEVVSVCPEVLGGLPTPRVCSECQGEKVVNKNNEDVTDYFHRGARAALAKVKEEEVEEAVLQARSPSCGVHKIYDGTFSKTLIDGDGVFVKYLKDAGIPVKSSEDFKEN